MLRRAVRAGAAVMPLRDAPRHGQAEAEAARPGAARGVGAVEPVEQALQFFRRDRVGIIPERLKSLENAELYILNTEELNNLGVKNIEVNNTAFYVVDYNSEEILYSLGVNGVYKLSEM